MPPRARTVVASILVVGWTLAGVAYVTAPPVVDDVEIQDLEHSKRYARELERIGGKAGVLASDLDAWIGSLWEGKARAGTIAAATVLVAGAYVLLRRATPRAGERHARVPSVEQRRQQGDGEE